MTDILDNLLNLRWKKDKRNSFHLIATFWDGNRKRKITMLPPFRPYFFIRKKDLTEKVRSLILASSPRATISEVDAVTREGNKVVKISVNIPTEVRTIREILHDAGIRTYEADIPYVRRVMIDQGWKVKMPVKIAAFDVEVDASKGFPDVSNPTSRCLSIAIVDENEDIFISEDDEIEIFKQFWNIVRNYEVLFGWNSAVFDYPYIINRSKLLGVEFDRDMFLHVDLYGLFLRVFKKEEKSFKLKDVARRLLGEKVPLGAVIDFEMPGEMKKLTEFFYKRRDLLRFYNVDQTKATYLINHVTALINIYFTIAQYSHILPWHRTISREDKFRERKYISYNVIVDSLLLRKALESSPRIVFPTKVNREINSESKYTGALVLNPIQGYHDNVAVLDFAAMYPRVIRTFNISYETWTPTPNEGDIKARHGGFRIDREGLLPRIVAELEEIRSISKKMRDLYSPTSVDFHIWNARQFGFKLVLVSLYGVLGFEGARVFQTEIAENITSYCRDLVQAAIAWLKRRGAEVLYGDTDSLFIKLPQISTPKELYNVLTKEVLQELNLYIRDYVIDVYDVPPSRVCIEFKLDRIFSRLKLLSTKKRYYGKVVWEDVWRTPPYLYVKGLEVRRGDWPELAKKIQRDLMELDIDKKWNEIKNYLKKVKENLLAGKIPVEHLVIYKGISKPLEEYKAKTPHTQAAKILKAKGMEIRVGDKVGFIFLNNRVIPYERGIKLSRSELLQWWDKYVLPIAERLEIYDFKQTRLLVR